MPVPAPGSRKIVQLVALPATEISPSVWMVPRVYALADDGSVWRRDEQAPEHEAWERVPGLPEDSAPIDDTAVSLANLEAGFDALAKLDALPVKLNETGARESSAEYLRRQMREDAQGVIDANRDLSAGERIIEALEAQRDG